MRKRKEEIKKRKRLLEESKNERTWFKSHKHKLESTIKELEISNEILRKEVQLLHRPETNYPTTEHTNQDDQNVRSTQIDTNHLIVNLQDRVSNFILCQIDTQISKMEDNFNLENENKTDKTPPEMMPTKASDQVRNVAKPQQV